MTDTHELYGWLFTFNTYTDTWFAYRKSNSAGYWNGIDSTSKIYNDKDITKLIKKVQDGESKKST
jgi:hypothetical protein